MSRTIEDCVGDISSLIVSLRDLDRQAIQALAPVVERLVHTRSRDGAEIERVLDRLLNHAGNPEGLAFFKDLCRYYYSINPQAAAEYVMIYRKQWETGETAVKV